MQLKDDIRIRIHRDFGQHADEAIAKLRVAIDKTKEPGADRIIRCILFLAKGNVAELNTYIEAAALDPRDVVLWAEYEKSDTDPDYTRVRDFSNTFDESSIVWKRPFLFKK